MKNSKAITANILPQKSATASSGRRPHSFKGLQRQSGKGLSDTKKNQRAAERQRSRTERRAAERRELEKLNAAIDASNLVFRIPGSKVLALDFISLNDREISLVRQVATGIMRESGWFGLGESFWMLAIASAALELEERGMIAGQGGLN